MKKSTVEEIRQRFDQDVERFSNLETGQSATVDARLALDLVAEAASRTTPQAHAVLDIGCGAGNYTLRLLQEHPRLDCTLLDLSRPMLDRAVARVGAATTGKVQAIQGDVRTVDLGREQFDIVLAAATLHHLRTDAEWDAVFTKVFEALRPGGSFWIFDLVTSSTQAVEDMMRLRYGEYLVALKDTAYRDHVFAYIEAEDTPRPLTEQLMRLAKLDSTRSKCFTRTVASQPSAASNHGPEKPPPSGVFLSSRDRVDC